MSVNIARRGQLAHLIQGIKTWGVKGTIYQIKFGDFQGEDQLGNKYYENLEYPYGQHRWVEYKNWYYDASQVPAGWHAWLHHVCDETPFTAKPGGYHVDFNAKGNHPYHIEELTKASHAIYNHNMGKVQLEYEENKTQAKSRGYEVGSGWGYVDDGKKSETKNYSYMQAGHPLSDNYQPSVNKVAAWNPTSAKAKGGSKNVPSLKTNPENLKVETHGYYPPAAADKIGRPQINKKLADE